jgi:glutathione synthase/RimK-type ligase-like ATP-grasp enzyme
MKRLIITCYNVYSEGAKNLQESLKSLVTNRRVLRVRRDSKKFKPRQSDFVIAWGNCKGASWVNQDQEAAKAIACNKLKTFEKFKEHNVPHPEWTTDKSVAEQWWWDKKTIVQRTNLTGHSGDGIVLSYYDGEEESTVCDLLDAPLYVQYKKKKHEYRVHVFNQEVIDIVQKKRKAGFEGRNNQIRNHQNGWVFCRENIQEPDFLRDVAIQACNAVGVLFGAVDIIFNEKENKCYALEINTAPGIEGTTVEKYATKFVELLNANQAV